MRNLSGAGRPSTGRPMSFARTTTLLSFAAATLLLGACSSSNPSNESRLGSRYGEGDRYQSGRPYGRPGSVDRGKLGGRYGEGDDIVYFSSDSSDLTPEGQETLRAMAASLRQGRGVYTIEGHADERGTREYNIALGARRAAAVRSFLVREGVQPSQIRTVSFGKERPVAVCNDISCWSQNRRAQVVVGG